MESYTIEQIEEFKNTSIPFPLIIESEQNKITEIITIHTISGMADNNGMPTEITIHNNKPNKTTKKYTYRLTNVAVV